MQDLGIQAAARVSARPSRSRTLRDLCQNFPFAARTLSKLKVDRALQSEVQHAQSSLYGAGYSGLFLNGLPLPIQDNDFFGLLQTIQREMHTVDALASLELPSASIIKLVALPPPTASLRIDPSHPAVLYINNIEKERRYQQFGTLAARPDAHEHVRPDVLLPAQRAQHGLRPRPDDRAGQGLLSYVALHLRQGAPIRFGVVFAVGGGKAAARQAGGSEGKGAPAATGSRRRAAEGGADAAARARRACTSRARGRRRGRRRARGRRQAAGFRGRRRLRCRRRNRRPRRPPPRRRRGADGARSALLLDQVLRLPQEEGRLAGAARFLSAINDARQSATAAFFGGGLDDLDEQHVVSAFRDAFTSTMRKSGRSPSEVLGQLRSGSVEEVEALYAGGRRFLEEKGLGEVPCVLTNGVLTPLSDDYEREVMTALNVEHRFVTQIIQRSQLTDDMADIPAAIAKAASAFPRYSKELLLPTESISLAELKPGSPTLASGVVWVGAPMPDAGEAAAAARPRRPRRRAPPPRRARRKAQARGGRIWRRRVHVRRRGSAAMEEGDADDDDDGRPLAAAGRDPQREPPAGARPLQRRHLAVAAGALDALESSPKGRARLGLLHNPADAACAAPAAAGVGRPRGGGGGAADLAAHH